MPDRRNISSGAPWEDVHGYSRAVRIGNLIVVSGTVASDEQGRVVGLDDPYTQTAYAIRKIARALEQTGASLGDVVRTRLFVTDIIRWEEVARAHREAFGAIRPASTLVEVRRLIDEAYLVEIEADAVVNA